MSVDLEKFCVIHPYELAWRPPYDGKFHQIRPGVLRKVYPSSKKGRPIYMGAVLEPRDQIRPLKEIAKLVDKRSWDQLQKQARDALEQIIRRAACGDRTAIEKLATTIRALVGTLDDLAKFQPKKMRSVARTLSTWPVNLSLNPQDIKWTKEDLRLLAVGTNAPIPTRPGQRVDPRNFWTKIAAQALRACRINIGLVRELKTYCAGAKRTFAKKQFWGTTAKATFYSLADGSAVIITDWQRNCVKLTEPITDANYKDWWAAVKACVLQHWKLVDWGKKYYAEALKQIGRESDEEWRRRNLAIDRVEQALRSFVGLQ